jgi:peptide-methionine (S)-S-oxide reductase
MRLARFLLVPSAILALFACAVLSLVAPATAQQRTDLEVATFAGGCFWCVESDFDKVDGVVSTISGFMGGEKKDVTYKEVTYGKAPGHLEVVQIMFDPKKVSYERLLHVYWRTIDPLDVGGQFCDRGESYTTAVFAHSDVQLQAAQASKKAIAGSGRFKQPIATQVRPASHFSKAEDYHQDYYKKDPGRYYSYRASCGRDQRVKSLWGDEAGGGKATQ